MILIPNVIRHSRRHGGKSEASGLLFIYLLKCAGTGLGYVSPSPVPRLVKRGGQSIRHSRWASSCGVGHVLRARACGMKPSHWAGLARSRDRWQYRTCEVRQA